MRLYLGRVYWPTLLVCIHGIDIYICGFVILYETFVIGYLVEETYETVGLNKNMDSLLQK